MSFGRAEIRSLFSEWISSRSATGATRLVVRRLSSFHSPQLDTRSANILDREDVLKYANDNIITPGIVYCLGFFTWGYPLDSSQSYVLMRNAGWYNEQRIAYDTAVLNESREEPVVNRKL